MMKKLLAFGLILVLVFSVVGCTQDDKGGETPPADNGGDKGSSDKFNVYLITMDQMDQHWVTVDQGAKKSSR